MLRQRDLSVCPSYVYPAVGRNELPFGRDIRVVPCNIVLYMVPGTPRKEEIWRLESSSQQCRLRSPNYFGPCFIIVIKGRLYERHSKVESTQLAHLSRLSKLTFEWTQQSGDVSGVHTIGP